MAISPLVDCYCEYGRFMFGASEHSKRSQIARCRAQHYKPADFALQQDEAPGIKRILVGILSYARNKSSAQSTMKVFSQLFEQQASTPKVALEIMTVCGYDRQKYPFITGPAVVHMNAQCLWLQTVVQRIQSRQSKRLQLYSAVWWLEDDIEPRADCLDVFWMRCA